MNAGPGRRAGARVSKRLRAMIAGAVGVSSLAGFGGCAANAAREHLLAPAVAAAWPAIRDDAELGAKARANPDAAKALGVDLVDPGVVESAIVAQDKFGEAVLQLVK